MPGKELAQCHARAQIKTRAICETTVTCRAGLIIVSLVGSGDRSNQSTNQQDVLTSRLSAKFLCRFPEVLAKH